MPDSIDRSTTAAGSGNKEAPGRDLGAALPPGSTAPDSSASDRLSDLQRQAKEAVEKIASRHAAGATDITGLAGALDTVGRSGDGAKNFVAERPNAPVRQARIAGVTTVPRRGRGRSHGGLLSFVFCVIAPVLAVGIYYFGFASDQFVVEFQFSVRDSKSATNSQGGAGGIQDLLGGGSSPNSSENYILTEYLKSRQVVSDLEARVDATKMYSKPEVDWVSRFDSSLPIERFVTYWRRMTSARYDQITGISSAEVRAFSAADAYLIATTLLALSEDLVNKVINKPLLDAVRFAEEDVRRAEERLKTIRAELTRYRNAEQLIDPQSSVVTSNVSLAQTLRANLSQMETDLSTLRKQQSNPNAPIVVAIQTRIKATKEQLAVIEAQVGTISNGNKPLSAVVGQYEQLDLERQFAQSMVLMTMQALDQARSKLISQHIYVTPFVNPALPETSTYPRRYLILLVASLLALLFWIIGLLVVRSVREHLS